ncbi:HepT-like ribonuclease domain-containing protein [Deinococcus oregonensis]|uniref:HepT-like ribonuclease domain-containing protein n=1 Tax=Deinococcus oregonensis TaxID=1805970 RepID=A0ABV6B1J4_9DEIO
MTQPASLFPDLRLYDVARTLQENADHWRALGVVRVRVFGSVAREQARNDSDVDLLVDFASSDLLIGPPAGLLQLMRVKALFEAVLERRVDVLTEGGLKPALRREILADCVDVMNAGPPIPPREGVKRWRWRVFDLLDAVDRAVRFTAPHTLATFAADEQAQDAVLHNLARLGETTKFIPQRIQDTHPEVPWALLRDIRNLVSHDYFGIDRELLWNTARHELPPLRAALQALAEGGGEGSLERVQ